jgi:hypothetical protein
MSGGARNSEVDIQRLKFQNLLTNRVKELELLSQSMVYKEKE